MTVLTVAVFVEVFEPPEATAAPEIPAAALEDAAILKLEPIGSLECLCTKS